MKKQIITILAIGLASAAFAGINPANPGLPSVTDTVFAAAVANNNMSAMCVDCHTRAPRTALGTHYIAVGDTTNSGGSGNKAARNGGEYFKTSAWNAAGASGVNWLSEYGTSGGANVTGAAVLATSEIICESCHSIVQNEAGGNNLLDVMGDGTNIIYQNSAASSLCNGCHGFMYTLNAANATAPANANYGSALGQKTIGGAGLRDNNEQHNILGPAFDQNHHVMTGDNIDAIRAVAGLLWTDNTVIAYSDVPIANTSANGTFPVNLAWTGVTKPGTAGWLNCNNCHAPGHGGGVTEGASILLNATAGAAVNAWDRISDGRGYKNFNDLGFCGQCHKN